MTNDEAKFVIEKATEIMKVGIDKNAYLTVRDKDGNDNNKLSKNIADNLQVIAEGIKTAYEDLKK